MNDIELASYRHREGRKADEVATEKEMAFPDGGWKAYSVVCGSFFGAMTCLGLINSIGTIQAYVSIHQLSDLSEISVSWVFSIYMALSYAIGVIIGPIFDYKGSTPLLIVATCFIFTGLMGAASSKVIYQFILSFICLGIGNGIGMTPVVGVINHWFLRKRGLITGVVTSGGSVGGLAFPLLLRHTFAKYGYVWALRILAFVNGGCMLLAVFLVKDRVRRSPANQAPLVEGSNIDVMNIVHRMVAILKKHSDKTYLAHIAGSFCAELSLVLTLTYFVTYAVAQGVSESTGYLLVTCWNATSIGGRILPGFWSDKVGKFNVHIAMLFGLNLCMFVIWLGFGHSLSALYCFACIGGFFSGSILGMIPSCLAQITKVSEFGERYGILNFILSFGNLIGIPIGAAIIGNGSVHNYDMFVVLVSCLSLAGCLLTYVARCTIVGFRLNSKV